MWRHCPGRNCRVSGIARAEGRQEFAVSATPSGILETVCSWCAGVTPVSSWCAGVTPAASSVSPAAADTRWRSSPHCSVLPGSRAAHSGGQWTPPSPAWYWRMSQLLLSDLQSCRNPPDTSKVSSEYINIRCADLLLVTVTSVFQVSASTLLVRAPLESLLNSSLMNL